LICESRVRFSPKPTINITGLAHWADGSFSTQFLADGFLGLAVHRIFGARKDLICYFAFSPVAVQKLHLILSAVESLWRADLAGGCIYIFQGRHNKRIFALWTAKTLINLVDCLVDLSNLAKTANHDYLKAQGLKIKKRILV